MTKFHRLRDAISECLRLRVKNVEPYADFWKPSELCIARKQTSKKTTRCCQAQFRRQHKLGPYVLDFYCPETKLAVECNGLPHFTPEGIEKDRFRTQWLNRQGVEVIRFTSNEIENDTQRVLLEIDMVVTRLLNQDKPPHPPPPSPPEEEKGR